MPSRRRWLGSDHWPLVGDGVTSPFSVVVRPRPTAPTSKRAAYAADYVDDDIGDLEPGKPDAGDGKPVQRQAATPVTVQRHGGFRTKPRLEVPELDPLQFAASRADRALEFGRNQNRVEVT